MSCWGQKHSQVKLQKISRLVFWLRISTWTIGSLPIWFSLQMLGPNYSKKPFVMTFRFQILTKTVSALFKEMLQILLDLGRGRNLKPELPRYIAFDQKVREYAWLLANLHKTTMKVKQWKSWHLETLLLMHQKSIGSHFSDQFPTPLELPFMKVSP